jgi:hypothetical protein
MADVHFVDGQQLTPSDFGEVDSGYGHWKAKKFSGTHGTNGFYLDMKQDTTNNHFNTLLYTGTGSNQSIGGVGFQPDLIWFKSRSSANSNLLYDSVRGNGPNKAMHSDHVNGEGGAYMDNSTYDYMSSIDSDGFSVVAGSTPTYLTKSGDNYVAWCWKAGGSASSNTNGSITSQVSANPDNGETYRLYIELDDLRLS